MRTQQGRVDGIYVEEKTWRSLADLADEFGVDEDFSARRE